MKVRKSVIVKGRVQGVAFRHHTQSAARVLGVNGWVRNLYDGSVEACFEGELAPVMDMVEWCRSGPPAEPPTWCMPQPRRESPRAVAKGSLAAALLPRQE